MGISTWPAGNRRARRGGVVAIFCAALEREGIEVARGIFGARTVVELANDGPVTIVLDG